MIEPRPLNKFIHWEPNVKQVAAILTGMFFISAVGRSLLGDLLSAPFIFGDEFMHIQLGRSLWSGNGTNWTGFPMNFPCWLYPLSLAPWLGLFPIDEALDRIRDMNAALFSLTIPIGYGFAREIASRRRALVAAALIALLPSFGYSATLMAECMFVPAYTLACWLGYRAIVQPTIGRRVAAGLVMALGFHIKPQGMYLPVLFAIAVLILEGLRARENRHIRKSAYQSLRPILLHALTAVAWFIGLMPRLAAMIWIDKLDDPFSVQNFLGSYFGLGVGIHATRSLGDFLYSATTHLSVWSTGIGFFPLLAMWHVFRKGGSWNNDNRRILGLTALIMAAGTIVLLVALLAGRRIHERYFLIGYPTILVAFCALAPRLEDRQKFSNPFLVWMLAQAFIFFFVMKPSIFLDWFPWVDSPTYSAFHLLLRAEFVSLSAMAAFLLIGLLAFDISLRAGRGFVWQAIATSLLLSTWNTGWYLAHDQVVSDTLGDAHEAAIDIAHHIPEHHKLIVLEDDLWHEVAFRALFYTAGKSCYFEDKDPFWFQTPMVLKPDGSIQQPVIDGKTWLLAGEDWRFNHEPALDLGRVHLYRAWPIEGPIRFLPKEEEEPEVTDSEE